MIVAMKRICVFCASSVGRNPAHAAAARRIGAELARRGIELVYGGGNIGLMGLLADAVLSAGGRAIGVIPRFMVVKELAHQGLTELRVVESMHQRKAEMAELADAFVALPGGLGTLEEFCEIVTWSMLGLHRKPLGMLNVDGVYDHFLLLLDRMMADALLKPRHRAMIYVESEPAALLDRLAAVEPPGPTGPTGLEKT